MAVYFFDTSALVKRYAPEDGTKWVQSITDPAAGYLIYIARITGAEVIAAIRQNVRNKDTSEADAAKVTADFRYDFANQYSIHEVTDGVVDRAMTLIEKHKLRGYDGVQLAAALEINDQLVALGALVIGGSGLVIVSGDKDIINAAPDEGIMVENPQNHLHPDDKVT